MVRSRRDVLRAVGVATTTATLAGGAAGCLFASGAECDADEGSFEPTVTDADATPTVTDADWPLRYRDAANTARAAGAGPTDGVVRAWATPERLDRSGETWVVAAGDAVYATARDGDALLALDPADGSVRRRFDGFDETGPPAVAPDAGLVLVGDRSGLHALPADGGERAWSTDGPALDASDRLAVADGTAYVAGRESVLAVDVATGERLWTADGRHLGAVAGGRVLAADGVRALDASDGAEVWSYADVTPFGAVSIGGSDGAADDSTAYVGELGRLHAYALADGSERWSHRGGTEDFRVPAVADDRLVVGTGRTEAGGGNVYAVDRESGERLWCDSLGFRGPPVTAVAGDAAYVAAGELVQARSLDDGSVRWTHLSDGREYASLAVADGVVFAGARRGRVDAFVEG